MTAAPGRHFSHSDGPGKSQPCSARGNGTSQTHWSSWGGWARKHRGYVVAVTYWGFQKAFDKPVAKDSERNWEAIGWVRRSHRDEQRQEIRRNFHIGGVSFHAGLCWGLCRNLGRDGQAGDSICRWYKMTHGSKDDLMMLSKQVFKWRRSMQRDAKFLCYIPNRRAKWDPGWVALWKCYLMQGRENKPQIKCEELIRGEKINRSGMKKYIIMNTHPAWGLCIVWVLPS